MKIQHNSFFQGTPQLPFRRLDTFYGGNRAGENPVLLCLLELFLRYKIGGVTSHRSRANSAQEQGEQALFRQWLGRQ